MEKQYPRIQSEFHPTCSTLNKTLTPHRLVAVARLTLVSWTTSFRGSVARSFSYTHTNHSTILRVRKNRYEQSSLVRERG
jgi:hypothetical protein